MSLYYNSRFTISSRPVIPDSIFEEMEGNVLGLSAGVAKFFNHAHRAIGVEAMHHNCRGALQVRPRSQKVGDSVTGALVVRRLGTIMLGHQIMIEKNRIVLPRLQ